MNLIHVSGAGISNLPTEVRYLTGLTFMKQIYYAIRLHHKFTSHKLEWQLTGDTSNRIRDINSAREH